MVRKEGLPVDTSANNIPKQAMGDEDPKRLPADTPIR
jgi:hypothetical protein